MTETRIPRRTRRHKKRMDGVQDFWEGEYTYRCILTNDYDSSVREIGGYVGMNIIVRNILPYNIAVLYGIENRVSV